MPMPMSMSNVPHVSSYYAASGLAQPLRPPLQGTVDADVCIVGAGYTGLNAAIHLAEQGFKVVVLEAARVGWGASGRNGGQIVHSYSRDVDVVEARFGAAVARPLAAMAFEGAQVLRERVQRYGIDCHLVDGGVYAAITARQVGHLAHQKALWERHGHPGLRLVEGAAMSAIVRSERYRALLVDPTGGHFHPLRLAQGEAAAVERRCRCQPAPGCWTPAAAWAMAWPPCAATGRRRGSRASNGAARCAWPPRCAAPGPRCARATCGLPTGAAAAWSTCSSGPRAWRAPGPRPRPNWRPAPGC